MINLPINSSIYLSILFDEWNPINLISLSILRGIFLDLISFYWKKRKYNFLNHIISILHRIHLSHLSICVIDSSDWQIPTASIPNRIPLLDPMVTNYITEKTILVLNKWDLLDDQQKSNMLSHFYQLVSPTTTATTTSLVPISCKTGEGLSDVWRHLSSLIEKE